jgi:hypothetical protein
MPREAFLLLFAVAAFVLAVWVDVRFPRLIPGTMGRLAVHVVAATLICAIGIGPAMEPLLASGVAGKIAAIVAVALPALTYGMLGGVWAFRMTRAAMGGPLR